MSVEVSAIRTGAGVEASDGRLGAVDHVVARPDRDELAYLVVRRGWTNELIAVPGDAVREVAPSGTVHLTVTKEQARSMAGTIPREALVARQDGSTFRVPLHEEQLVTEKRLVDLGELRIHKLVDVTEEVVREAVTRDDLVVERVPVNQPLEAPIGSRVEDDWLVIPIMEEVVVVQKRLMLKEEIRIKKRQVIEEQEITETTRHERVEFEDATVHGVQGLDTAVPAEGTPAAAPNTSAEVTSGVRTTEAAEAATSDDATVPIHVESHGESHMQAPTDEPVRAPEDRQAPADDVTRPVAIEQQRLSNTGRERSPKHMP